MSRTYSAFYQDDQSAIIYRRKPNDGTLEKLPRGAKPVEHPSSTYYRTDGGDKYEFAFFAKLILLFTQSNMENLRAHRAQKKLCNILATVF
jgi:hypothetical protein